MKFKSNSWWMLALAATVASCGSDDEAVDMTAEGLDYVQRVPFDSPLQSEALIGGVRQVDAIAMVATENALAAHMIFSRSAFDFNDQDRVYEEGAVVLHERDGEGWRQTQVFTATTADNGADLGRFLAIAGDWLFAAYGRDIWILERDEQTWSVNGVLSDVVPANRCISGLSATETMLAVANSCPPGTLSLFERIGTEWRSRPAPAAPDDTTERNVDCAVGPTVALSETALVLGLPGGGAANDETKGGYVLVYERSDDAFAEPEIIVPVTATATSGFGCQVAVDDQRIAVGSPLEDQEAGAVYVFERTTGQWSETARLQASNQHPDQWFGFDVALTSDRLVVGAPRENGEVGGVNNFGDTPFLTDQRPGAAYVFERQQSEWSQLYYLKDERPMPDDGFGAGVVVQDEMIMVGPAAPPAIHVWSRAQ